MGGLRNAERQQHVKVFARLAAKYAVPHPAASQLSNASKQRVGELVGALATVEMTACDKETLRVAQSGYDATFVAARVSENKPDRDSGPTWKFQAVQLTFQSDSLPEWCSYDMVVLKSLFDRFTNRIVGVATALKAVGVSTTMERGSSCNHVHCHAYMHLEKPFHRRGRNALDPFKFEDLAPHVTPNTASGKTYMGAVRFGHFYVVVPKIGSLLLGL